MPTDRVERSKAVLNELFHKIKDVIIAQEQQASASVPTGSESPAMHVPNRQKARICALCKFREHTNSTQYCILCLILRRLNGDRDPFGLPSYMHKKRW